MNEYNINVDFTKGRISTNLRKLVQNDYNTTKLNFTFDKEGRVLFKMLYPDGTQYVDEIQNNELVFGKGVLNQEGTYEYEISLYSEDGRLTDYAVKSFEVRSELVDTDEIVELDDRVPVLDTLINEVSTIKQDVEDGKYNGITPTIGENGNWYLDDKDTSMPSRGEKGEQFLYSFTVDDGDAIKYLMGDFSDSFSGYKLSDEVVAQIQEHINYVYQKGEDSIILRGIFKNTKATLNIPLYEKLFTWDNDAKGGLQEQPIIIALETLSDIAQNSYTIATIRIDLTWTNNVAKVSSVKLFGYKSKFLSTNYPIDFIPTSDNHPVTKKYVDDSIADIEDSDVDLSNYYTKEETDNAIASIDIPEVDLTDYATTEYVDEAIAGAGSGSNCEIYEVKLTNFSLGTNYIVSEEDKNTISELITKVKSDDAKYPIIILNDKYSSFALTTPTNPITENYPNWHLNGVIFKLINSSQSTSGQQFYSIVIKVSGTWENEIFTCSSINVTTTKQEYLSKNNSSTFTPTGDYNPATKKYVDEAIAGAGGGIDGFYAIELNMDFTGSDSVGITQITELDEVISDSYNKGYKNILLLVTGSGAGCTALFQSATSLSSQATSYKFKGINEPTTSSLANNTYLTYNGSWNGDVFTGSYGGISVKNKPYLSLVNTKSYTPTSNYHPATKKYVDDAIAQLKAELSGGTE